MKKQVWKFLFFLVIPAFFIGCQKSDLSDEFNAKKDQTNEGGYLKNSIVYCGTPLVANMVDFQQTIVAGSVTIGNDASKLYVTYDLTGDWWIKNAVLFVGPASEAGNIQPDGSGEFAPGYGHRLTGMISGPGHLQLEIIPLKLT